MFDLPSWLKLNKNWVPSQVHIREGWITVDIFRETATRKHRVSSYREIEHSEPLMIEDLKAHLFSYFINRKRYVFKDISSHFITSASRKYNLSPQQVIGQYIDAGYLGKETTFQRDGLTVADTRYGLTSRALHEVKQLKEALVHKNNDWIEEMKEELNSLRELFRNEYTVEQQQLMDFVATRLKECEEEGKSHLWPSLSWTYSREAKPGYYQKAIEFILSLLHCMYKAEVFDWKEIGSRLNPSIGASKQFDPIKDDLLNLLEQITQKEPEQLGIISLGSLYSVYISGSMAFETNHYSQALSGDSVHCLSNIQIQQIQAIQTTASRVILTENRSILLKMYKTRWVNSSRSLVLGLDGHLRAAHRHLITSLMEHALSMPFFIWVDGDASGRDIAANLVKIVPKAKIIGIQNGELRLYDTLYEWMDNTEYQDTEQESVMGGVKQWEFLFCSENSRLPTPHPHIPNE